MQVISKDQLSQSQEEPTVQDTNSTELEFLAKLARPHTSEVLLQQYHLLYRQTPLWLLLSQTLAIACCIFFWSQSHSDPLLTWLSSISLFTLLPGLLLYRFQQQPRILSPLRRGLFLGGLAIIGLHWGTAPVWLALDIQGTLSLSFILIGLLVLALPLLRQSIGAMLILPLTMLLPALVLIFQTPELHWAALPLVLVTTIVLFSGRRENRENRNSLAHQLEYNSLVHYLTIARQQAEQLNRQLTKEIRQRELAERQLQENQRELEQKVQDRTRRLANANEQLSQQVELRKSISAALVKSQTRLSQAIEASQLALWDWDLTTGHVYQSSFNEVFGPKELTSAEFMENMRQRVHEDDYQRVRDELSGYLRGQREHYKVQYRVRTDEGRWMWVEDCGKAVQFDLAGGIRRMLGTRRDISNEKHWEEQLRMVKSVFDNTSEGVFVLDTEFHFVMVNPAYTRITGYQPEELIGRSLVEVSQAPNKEDTLLQARDQLLHTGAFRTEWLELRQNGEQFPGHLHINAIRNSAGEITHYAGLLSDLTELKQADERLKYLQNYDSLTGLANRTLFRSRLHDALHKSRTQKTEYAVLNINIDRFRQLNESLGHDIGDNFLLRTAQRLTALLPDADTLARLGTDEFCVILETGDRSEVARRAEQILEALSAPQFISRHELLLTASIGITLIPANAREMSPVLQQANVAVRHAKYLGGNKHQFYSHALKALFMQQLTLETELRKALQSNGLEVYYQPKLQLANDRIESVEALVRWRHPTRGVIPPAEFVPLAEESGLIAEVGAQVLYSACRQAQAWQEAGLGQIRVSVNLSAHQLRQSSLVANIRAVLEQTGLPPSLLDLELTESSLMENVSRSLSILHKLRAMGIRVTIDDFGTGYSSLSYLKQLPIDAIKIDRIFIRDLVEKTENAAITHAIIRLGQSLHMEVIAEGIESQQQLDFLKAQGCNAVQGFFIAPALSTEQMTALLQQQLASVTPFNRVRRRGTRH